MYLTPEERSNYVAELALLQSFIQEIPLENDDDRKSIESRIAALRSVLILDSFGNNVLNSFEQFAAAFGFAQADKEQHLNDEQRQRSQWLNKQLRTGRAKRKAWKSQLRQYLSSKGIKYPSSKR